MISVLEILQRAPIQEFYLLKAILRRRYGTVDWPEHRPTTTLAIDTEALEAQLRRHHFEDVSGWSLRYEGEVLNFRRPADVDEDGTPLELHLRARESVDGLAINGHLEPCRWESTVAHVESDRLDWLNETELRTLLESCGLTVDPIES